MILLCGVCTVHFAVCWIGLGTGQTAHHRYPVCIGCNCALAVCFVCYVLCALLCGTCSVQGRHIWGTRNWANGTSSLSGVHWHCGRICALATWYAFGMSMYTIQCALAHLVCRNWANGTSSLSGVHWLGHCPTFLSPPVITNSSNWFSSSSLLTVKEMYLLFKKLAKFWIS